MLYNQHYYGNVTCIRFAQSTVKICQWDFLRVAALKCTKTSTTKTIKEIQSLIELSEVPLKFVNETSDGQLLSWSFLCKAFYKQTAKEIKFLRELLNVLLNLSVRLSQGSCFKVLYESRKWPAPLVEERNLTCTRITENAWVLIGLIISLKTFLNVYLKVPFFKKGNGERGMRLTIYHEILHS